MKKIQTSMKSITRSYCHVFRVGYCDLQNIFYDDDPVYYNSGVYGWNCDIYVDWETDTAFTTGYRNMRGEQIPLDILRKYDTKAREILATMWSDPEYKEKLYTNRCEFIKELLRGKNHETE